MASGGLRAKTGGRIFDNMQALTDFRLKITKAADANHYRWEICRFGNPVWIERSMNDFATDGEACRDGALALSRLQNREAQTQSMPVTTSAEASTAKTALGPLPSIRMESVTYSAGSPQRARLSIGSKRTGSVPVSR